MSDIVDRLRIKRDHLRVTGPLLIEAADEIERLRGELQQMGEAMSNRIDSSVHDHGFDPPHSY